MQNLRKRERSNPVMRQAVKVFAAALTSVTLLGCGAIQREPLRIDNAQIVSAQELGFQRGKTKFTDAHNLMKKRRMTGISTESNLSVSGKRLDLLAADYQTEMFLFEEGTFRQSLKLHTSDILPYGFALRIANSKNRDVILALYRDPLEMVSSVDHGMRVKPPRIEIFVESNGNFVRNGILHLSKLSKTHGGLTDPLFVGHDLDINLMLIARGLNGVIWNKAYFLGFREVEGQVRLAVTKSVPLSEAAKCSCVQDYLYGESDSQ
jgi:hypothetical protein